MGLSHRDCGFRAPAGTQEELSASAEVRAGCGGRSRLFRAKEGAALRVRAWRTSARGRTALAPDRGPEGPAPAAELRLRSRRAAQSPFQQLQGVAGPCEKQPQLRGPREHLLTSRGARSAHSQHRGWAGAPAGEVPRFWDSFLKPQK